MKDSLLSYYNNPKNVEQYIKMADGYDGRIFVDILRQHLPDKATVLELGMGPGKDLLLLNEYFQVTGSDYSAAFIERFRKQHPDMNVIQLDAVTMNVETTFDCIYSNKVLHHLTRDELRQSLDRQVQVLNSGGVVCHSFWYGDKEEEYSGLRFIYYTEATLKALISDNYEIVAIERYTEMEDDDSLYILLRKT